MPTNNDVPQYVVPADARIPADDHPSRMVAIPSSRMFLIKKSLATYLERVPDGKVFDASQGDGGASLPGVPAEVLEHAMKMQVDRGTGYDMPYGCDAFRRSVVEEYWQADSATGIGPANILAGMGGRDVLVKAYSAMLNLGHGRIGDVIVTTRVPWISYNWGPYGVGANVMIAGGNEDDAWTYTEESIKDCVDLAAKEGRKVAGLIITSPDNPTGKTITVDRQVALGKAALRAGAAFVLYDWMYHQVTDESPVNLNTFITQFDDAERKKVMILDGITKSLGASNIRNCHLVASPEVVKFIQSRASHGVIPSFFSQAVAMAAYQIGFRKAAATIIEPTNASRKVLNRFVTDNGFTAITGKGYYAFINVAKWLRAAGMEDSSVLGQFLAEQHGVAVVPGVYFSSYGKDWIRFSYALPPEKTTSALERFKTGLATLES